MRASKDGHNVRSKRKPERFKAAGPAVVDEGLKELIE